MTRNEKIQLLKMVAAGIVTADEMKKQLAIAAGHYEILVGLDAEEFDKGIFPTEKLIFIKGKPARLLSKEEYEEIMSGSHEEVYV